MRRLPYIITFLFPLQSVLTAIGARYAVYALLAGGTAFYVLRAIVYGRSAEGFGTVWVFIGYLAILAVLQWSVMSLYGFLVYVQFALFWMAYSYAYGRIDVVSLTKTNLSVAMIVAVIGIYQYFFNPTLSGFSTFSGVEIFYSAGA